MSIPETWREAFDLMLADRQAEREARGNLKVLNILRGSILVRTQMILDAAGVSTAQLELEAIREMRNAIVHNRFDIALNRNPHAMQKAQDYLQDLQSGRIARINGEPAVEYFSLNGTTVEFNREGFLEECRQIIMRHLI